jgi:LysM repeat protein
MKLHTLPVKRKPVSKGVFKRLSAVTRSRKQRVAATADDDLEHEDHSSKISRALTIIFLIHIVVIGLIFFHQKFLDDGAPKQTTAKKVTAPAPVRSENTLPKLSNGDAIYRVVPGDNYTRIATAQEVDENELRAANSNVDIVPGLIMKIPPKRIVAMDPPEVAAIRGNTPLDRDRGLVEAVPVSGGAPRAQLVKAAMPENLVTVQKPAAAPVIAKPRSTPPPPPRATPVAAAPPAATPSAKSYVVQSGDNVWRIANKFKVDQKALMKANGISDPKKLKLGMSLKIPH